jgi:hypothetical protein
MSCQHGHDGSHCSQCLGLPARRVVAVPNGPIGATATAWGKRSAAMRWRNGAAIKLHKAKRGMG